MNELQTVEIDYTNYRGERRKRRVIPRCIEWENSERHTQMQWVLRALDVEKGEARGFAMKDIHSWKPV